MIWHLKIQRIRYVLKPHVNKLKDALCVSWIHQLPIEDRRKQPSIQWFYLLDLYLLKKKWSAKNRSQLCHSN